MKVLILCFVQETVAAARWLTDFCSHLTKI